MRTLRYNIKAAAALFLENDVPNMVYERGSRRVCLMLLHIPIDFSIQVG